MPRAEPVTIATLSSSTPMFVSSMPQFGAPILPDFRPAGVSHNPYERPITSSMISSVPAPIRLSRMSRHARSIPYSRM